MAYFICIQQLIVFNKIWHIIKKQDGNICFIVRLIYYLGLRVGAAIGRPFAGCFT